MATTHGCGYVLVTRSGERGREVRCSGKVSDYSLEGRWFDYQQDRCGVITSSELFTLVVLRPTQPPPG